MAHDLCDTYDVMVFEDLNIAAMKRRWGRKVGDLGFAPFMHILKWVAFKWGMYIDQWERTTGECSGCGHNQQIDLKDRVFACEQCGLVLDRDHNAAINLLELGHQLLLSRPEEDLAYSQASGVHGSSPRL